LSRQNLCEINKSCYKSTYPCFAVDKIERGGVFVYERQEGLRAAVGERFYQRQTCGG